ncbi:MAG: DegV family protein [Actinobacteria bacterium]|nr:DegV family protein [Actinomycetota bacterium]MCL6104274.1 DegV family protein [Actinomycetota bacterium]
MPNVKVITDSGCDLPDNVSASQQIEVVPLTIRFGEKEFVDKQDLSPEEFWQHCLEATDLPQTAAPSPGSFEKAFRQAAKDGYNEVICITLSAGISASYQSAVTAASLLNKEIRVLIFDSKLITIAQGMLVMEACSWSSAGLSLDDLEVKVKEMRDGLRLLGTLDTLEYLKKGGRIGNARAFLGSLLEIKPLIELRNGIVEPESKTRTRAKALTSLVDKVRQAEPTGKIGVSHGMAQDIESFTTQLQHQLPDCTLYIGQIGAVLGAHTGPGTIGVAFTPSLGFNK